MKYQEIAHLDGEKFRRLTGVKPSTFRKMLEILTMAHKAKVIYLPARRALAVRAAARLEKRITVIVFFKSNLI